MKRGSIIQKKVIWVSILVALIISSSFSTYAASKPNAYGLIILGRSKVQEHVDGVNGIQTVLSRNQLATFKAGKGKAFDADKGPYISKKEFLKSISDAYKKASKNDYAYFCFSGHGVKDGFLLKSGTVVSYKEVAQELAKIKCNKIICIINCCYSGNFLYKGLAKLSKANQKRFIAFTSCKKDQKGGTRSGWYGRFLKAFTDGLGYSDKIILADFNNDQKVTVKELHSYVDMAMRGQLLDGWPADQNPVTYAENVNDVVFKYNYYAIKLDKSSLNLRRGSQSVFLNASVTGINGKVSWRSGNNNVASVTNNGEVIPKGKGRTTIYATIGKATVNCTVNVA